MIPIAGNKTILVFIDDTGNELLKDPNYPLFGLGGCMILSDNYDKEIVKPWLDLKDSEFNGKINPLHATDLRNLSKEQITALNTFFRTKKFKRFACVYDKNTTLINVKNIFLEMVGCLRSHITALLKLLNYDSILFIIENSDSINRNNFKTLHWLGNIDEFNPVKTDIMFKTKKDLEPGLEVADFIINTFGSTYNSKSQKKIQKSNDRLDYYNVFGIINIQDISTIELSKIQVVGYVPD
jgi:hypothetical protein